MTNKRKLYQTFLMTMVMMLLFPLTAVAESVGYAVFNSESGTLTFKYGEKPNAGTKETVYDLNEANNEPRWWVDDANESITKVVFDESFSQTQPTTCFAWFIGCSNLTSIEGIENLNTSSVTDMRFMFSGCSELTSLDLSYFNTSNVMEMVGMFQDCVKLTTIYVSNSFQTGQVQTSENMFAECTSLEGIIPCDGQFNIDKTCANFTNGYFLAVPYVKIDGSAMYFKCDGNVKPDGAYSLNEGTQTPGWSDKASEISYVKFDESFKNIRPTSCYKWFSGFSYLKALDLSYLNTSKVTNMSEMFKGCSRLNKINVSDKFTTDNVQSSNEMFAGCTSLEGLIKCDGINNIDKTYANFTNGYLSAVPYATLSDGVLTFKCDGAKLGWALIDGLQGWNFDNPNSITKVVFDESFKNARPINCLDWFFECRNLNTIEGFENFNTSKVTNMREMFKHCHGLKSLDLTNFDTSNVTDMGLMFYDCPGLTTIYVSDKFTTDNVQKSEEMFSGCTSLSGAITCDGTNNIDGTYANYFTGYFTYGIKSADDLASFAKCVNTAGKDGGEAVLLNDITMTAEDNFTPITRNYTGKFDGQGHTISGLNLSESKNCLFAQNGGTIKNLGVVNATIAEGVTGSLCQTNSGTMEKCFFMATTTSSEGATMPNGAVCQTNKGTITRCYYLASNEVSNGGKTAEQFEGGAVCYLLNDGMTDGTQTWYQNIDNGSNDAYPVIDNTHGTVYPCTPCTGVYSNTVDTQKDHIYPTEYDDNGFKQCSHCEATQYQPATQNTSGQYEICNAGQLYWFAQEVNGGNAGINAVLTANITVNSGVLKTDGSIADDVSSFRSWTPIGNSDNKYTGTFDGKGYTVSGLYFNDSSIDYVGFFGYSCGTIKNVGVVDSYFNGNDNIGGVCGQNYNGTITNSYNTGAVHGDYYVGGVCGMNHAEIDDAAATATISNCYNTGIVIGNWHVGGICGKNYATSNDEFGDIIANITNCFNTGKVNDGRGVNVGGVCGYNEAISSEGPTVEAIIENCIYCSDTCKEMWGANGGSASSENVIEKTEAQFKSGEVAYLLNKGDTDGTQTWYQDLTAESGDIHPVLTKTNSNTVYQVKLYCGGGTVDAGTTYANNTEAVTKEHNTPETASFNSGKKIYEKLCQTEGCGKTVYYADAAGTIEATPNAGATEFTVAKYPLQDAKTYDNKAVFTATEFTYTRTFTTTEWTTWYVPFDLTLTEEICAQYEFSRINNVHQYDDDGDGTADKTVVESFRQNAGVKLKANYPYLVRAKSEGDFTMSLPLTNVVPAIAETNSIDCQSVDYKYTFTGTYAGMGDSGSADTAPYTLCDGNQWLHFHSLSPMRHYLTIESRNVSSPSPASMRSIMLSVVGDEDTTGIVKLYDEERKASETYDLSGRRLPAGSKPRGLIIENGKVTFKK